MSRFNTQLYVLNERIDLYEDDNITFNLKIQDARDIKKVFTDWSHPMTVPASKNNNRIFQHLLRNDQSSIDPRAYHFARFEINNAVFREGFVQFLGGKAKSGVVNSYNLRFYGGLALLSQRFGDDILKDLRSLYDLRPQYNSSAEFDAIWTNLLTTSTNDDLRICLNAFDEGYVYDSTWTVDTTEIEGYRNIAYFGDSQFSESVDERNDVGVELVTLKPSIRDNTILQGIENTYRIQFSRGEDENGFPTSDPDLVVKDHFFNTDTWLEEFTLLHNKSVDDTLDNAASIPLIWDQSWGNVTAEGSSTSALEAFFSGVIFVGATALTGGAAAAAVGAGGLATLGSAVTTGAIVGGGSGALAGTLTGLFSSSVDPSAYGNEEAILLVHNTGNILDVLYWLDVDITKTGTGAYNVRLEDENGNVLWTTGDQTQAFQSSQEVDYVELEFSQFSGGECDNCGPGDTAAGQPLTFNDGERIYTTRFLVRKDDEVQINISANITSRVNTRTRGVIFNDFQRNVRVTRNTFTGFASPAEFSILDELPKIKVVEWLTGKWQQFNLTARVEKDANGVDIITTRALEPFYDDGDTIDLTEYIDSQDYDIKIPPYYSPIIYKYADPSTFLSQEHDNKSERKYGYGSLSHDLNEGSTALTRLPYKEYKIELPFEQVVLNPLQDEGDDTVDLDILYGWIVSDSQSPTQIKPWSHYIENITANKSFLVKGLSGTFDEITTYNAATKFLRDENGVVQSLCFGIENEERISSEGGGETSLNTLFNNYHRPYIERVFNNRSRLYKFASRLPAGVLTRLGLDDTVVVGNDAFRINSIMANINNGKSTLELYSVDNTLADPLFGAAVADLTNTLFIDSFATNLDINATINMVTGNAILESTPFEAAVVVGGENNPTFTLYKNDTVFLTNDTGSFTTFGYVLGDSFFIRVEDNGFILDTDTISIDIFEPNRNILDSDVDPLLDSDNNPITDTIF